VLEQLYSPLILKTTPEYQELKVISKDCITRHHSHHYFGFAATQWKIFEKEQPHRVKPLLYTYRVLLTGIYLMQTGIVEANLIKLNDNFKLPYIPDLIAQKLADVEKSTLSNVDAVFHHREYERLRECLQEAYEASTLPEAPAAKSALHNLLIRLRIRS